MNGAGPQHSTVRGQIGHERAQQFRRNPPDRPEMPEPSSGQEDHAKARIGARERLQVCREGEIGKAPRGVKEHHVGPCRRIGEVRAMAIGVIPDPPKAAAAFQAGAGAA
jgi:hypothetical protein